MGRLKEIKCWGPRKKWLVSRAPQGQGPRQSMVGKEDTNRLPSTQKPRRVPGASNPTAGQAGPRRPIKSSSQLLQLLQLLQQLLLLLRGAIRCPTTGFQSADTGCATGPDPVPGTWRYQSSRWRLFRLGCGRGHAAGPWSVLRHG